MKIEMLLISLYSMHLSVLHLLLIYMFYSLKIKGINDFLLLVSLPIYNITRYHKVCISIHVRDLKRFEMHVMCVFQKTTWCRWAKSRVDGQCSKERGGVASEQCKGFVCVGFLLDLMSEVAHCSRIKLGEEWLSVDWLCSCLQLRLEEKSRENASLTRQLENALSDIRRQTEQTRDKALQKVMGKKKNKALQNIYSEYKIEFLSSLLSHTSLYMLLHFIWMLE